MDATTWGTWADWFGVAVALIGAIAVFYLGWEANRVAKTSYRIAAEAEAREGHILLVYLRPALTEAMDSTIAAQVALEGCSRDEFHENAEKRSDIRALIRGIELPDLTPFLPRLHTLGATADFLIGVADLAKRCTDQVAADEMAEGAEEFPNWFHWGEHDLQTAWLADLSERLQRIVQFAHFGGTIEKPNDSPY